ncbi:MAG: hypothetical protein CVV51_09100 [Spirochaetae bacterium HGW-Spirochaetae-7]|nr:MAG: hypothetical protein CVV51_09100 [Spirochaetae bacterium HGW-Spirochaetae-7]
MTICRNCGVGLEDSAKHCPLCRASVSLEPEAEAIRKTAYPEHVLDPEDFLRLSPEQRRRIFIEIYTVCTAMACVVVAAIELVLDKRIAWSLYPIASLCYLYLLVCAPVMLGRRRSALYAVLAPATLLFILALDVLDGPRAWFMPLGAPIVLLLEGVALASIELIARAKRKGVNAIAIALLGVATLCVGLELIIDARAAAAISLGWSVVVAITCVPIAGLLFWLHYRITGQASIAKIFRV